MKNISSKVVVSSMETSQVDEAGVTYFVSTNLFHSGVQNAREESPQRSQLDKINSMVRTLEAYKATLIAAGVSISEFPTASSTNLAGAGRRQGLNSYREALTRHGIVSAAPEPSQPAREPRSSMSSRSNLTVSGEPKTPPESSRRRTGCGPEGRGRR